MNQLIFFNLILIVSIIVSSTFADEYHIKTKGLKAIPLVNELEKTTEYWNSQAQLKLQELISKKLNTNNAKNVIMFIGDGMSIATVATTRMYLGGEEKELSFEKFPYYGFSKTYCVDAQVADSACTATAYLSGVKTNYEVIGLNAAAEPFSCSAQNDKSLHTESILSWAQKSCKATGIVTNTRITHASPAGTYAHIGHRDWENDHEMTLSQCDPNQIDDVAQQLVYNKEGVNMKVILGGGRSNFRDQSKTDEEGKNGYRTDGKDLIEEWKTERGKSGKAAYVWNREQLMNISVANTDYLLGLFEHDHMKYNLDVTTQNLQNQEPTLTDMATTAIKFLQKEESGYFLFVEGGMIDQAHHYTYAKTALDETNELAKAVAAARAMTSEEDTLIIVTSDHSHTFTYNGYPDRGSPIFSASDISDIDNLPYTTLSYANGPGYHVMFNNQSSRVNPITYNFDDHKLQYPATVPLAKETHGGEDVGVYASGPMAHLFSGHYEQNSIPLIMAYAMKVGPYATDDEKCASCSLMPLMFLTITMISILRIFK